MIRNASRTVGPWLAALLVLGCVPSESRGRAGERPRLRASVVDLGSIPHGRRVFATYFLENPEDRELPVRGVVVSCACAYLELRTVAPDGTSRTVDPSPRPEGEPIARIQPGGRLDAVIRYETAETPPVRASLDEPVAFYLDHPLVPRLDGKLTGLVLPRLQVQPPMPQFPPIPASGIGSLLIDLQPLPGEGPFQVLGFKGLSEKLKAQILLSGPERVRLRFTAGPGLIPGPLVLPVHVRTDLEDGYELPLLLRGIVVPDLALEPPPPLPFGSVDPSKGAQTSCLLTWRHQERALAPEISTLEAPEWIAARLVELEPGRMWRLELSCGPGALPLGPFAGSVRLSTNDAEHGEFPIPFNGHVQARP